MIVPFTSENGDDNLLMGFCIDNVSTNEKITIKVDGKYKELSPRCTLFCLTSEGKLNLFHAARLVFLCRCLIKNFRLSISSDVSY